jgi:transcriptional regulator with XRE-family HTH domain
MSLTLGKYIRGLREEKGWTQQQVEDMLNEEGPKLRTVSRTTYSSIERGITVPTLDVAATLCGIFGITLDEMVDHLYE